MTCHISNAPGNHHPSKPFAIPDDNEALGHELTRLAGHINAANHRFLKLLAVLVRREAWGGHGIKSPAHWLNYYCGISLGPAREKMRVALALECLPLIDAAFGRGEISYSKVRAMTRAATPANESEWLHIAQHGTAHHVETLVRQYQRVERLSRNDHARAQNRARELNWYYDDDGMLVIRGRLEPTEGQAVVKALQAVLDQNPDKNVSAETSPDPDGPEAGHEVADEDEREPRDTLSQQRADALGRLAEHFLATGGNGVIARSSGDRYQMVIHVHPPGAGNAPSATLHHAAHLEDGPVLAPATVRRLASDASRVTVLEDEQGRVLNVGRKTRSIPPAIRRALTQRDRGCRFPGCCERRFVDAHHIHHWCDGGETRLDNLVLLCRRHHRLLHEEGYEVALDETGAPIFTSPEGRPLAHTRYPQFSVKNVSAETSLEAEHAAMGLAIHEYTAVTRWQGETLDYDWAVQGLMSRQEPGYSLPG